MLPIDYPISSVLAEGNTVEGSAIPKATVISRSLSHVTFKSDGQIGYVNPYFEVSPTVSTKLQRNNEIE